MNAEQIAQEKLERILTAASLKEPDRVPLELNIDFGFKARWAGITVHDLFFDYEKAHKALLKTAIDFPIDFPPISLISSGSLLGFALRDHPDVSGFLFPLTGPMHDILGDTYTAWPGRELPVNAGSFQFLGGEFMKQDEYDKLLEDYVGFMAEVVIPRAHRSLRKPGSAEFIATIARATLEGRRYAGFLVAFMKDLAELGYPRLGLAGASVPVDFLGDFLRTITGILLDIRQVPAKVKQASDFLLKLTLENLPKFKDAHFTFMPLHLNEYLSPKLYDEFYWPYLKRIINESYNLGRKCLVAFEGRHDAHLNKILELPKGWGIGLFEKTDIRKAKEVLGGHTCVMGGIPPTMLLNATPHEVEKYIKSLLQDLMPGGGFIIASSTAIPAETPPENIWTVIKTVEKYGVYRR